MQVEKIFNNKLVEKKLYSGYYLKGGEGIGERGKDGLGINNKDRNNMNRNRNREGGVALQSVKNIVSSRLITHEFSIKSKQLI